MSHFLAFVIGVVAGGAVTTIFMALWMTATAKPEQPEDRWREP